MNVFTSTIVLALCGTVLCGFAGQDRAADPSGIYEGDGVRLEIASKPTSGKTSTRFAGTIAKGGRSFPFEAARDGSVLRGTFRVGEHSFAFSLAGSGDTLAFRTGKSTHTLRRRPTNPFDAPTKPKAPAAPANPFDATGKTDETDPKDGGAAPPASTNSAEVDRQAKRAAADAAKGLALDATFRHPTGFYFCHPKTWQRQAAGDGVLLLAPPDVLRTPQGNAELFLVIGDDAAGVKRPDDPRAVRMADAVMREILPTLKRTGKITKRRFALHEGAAILWSGTTPTGLKARAKMWITIVRDTALALLVVTTDDRFAKRERQADDMFATFGFTKPQRDARLIGTWRRDTYYSSGTFSMSQSTYLVLGADGSCKRGGTRLAGGMTHTDSGGNWTGSSTMSDGGPGNYVSGKWYSSGRNITIRWSGGGRETWEVLYNGRSMLFRSGKSKELWSRCK